MTSIRLIFRKSKHTHQQTGYLGLRLIHKRRVKLISTGIEIFSTEWDDRQRRIVSYSLDSQRNEFLREVIHRVNTKVLQLEQLKTELSSRGEYELDSLLRCYQQSKTKNSLQAFTYLLASDLAKQQRQRTSEAYLCAMRRFIRFHQQKDIALDELSPGLITRFEQSLKREGLKLNTISFYMRNLRAIYHKAVLEKRLPMTLDNPFQQVYTGVQVTRKRALSKAEMNKIYSLDLHQIFTPKTGRGKIKKLTLAKDLFMFSFYTRGMSFVDLAYLKKTDIKDDILSYYRKKTGQQLEIKITKPLRDIIDYYSLQCEGTPYLFPIIKDPRQAIRQQYLNGLRNQNTSLKELRRVLGIDKHLSTHVARHSWATIAKEEELPIWVISESLGHSSVKTTYIYLASINQTKLDKANEQVARAVCF